MQKSIILELMNGNVNYIDNVHANKVPEYEKCSNEFYGTLEKLCENLPENERLEIFDKLFLAQSGMECVTADEYFKAGFKLGLNLAFQNFLD